MAILPPPQDTHKHGWALRAPWPPAARTQPSSRICTSLPVLCERRRMTRPLGSISTGTSTGSDGRKHTKRTRERGRENVYNNHGMRKPRSDTTVSRHLHLSQRNELRFWKPPSPQLMPFKLLLDLCTSPCARAHAHACASTYSCRRGHGRRQVGADATRHLDEPGPRSGRRWSLVRCREAWSCSAPWAVDCRATQHASHWQN